jgi:rhodanese-related sulfurtransferase
MKPKKLIGEALVIIGLSCVLGGATHYSIIRRFLAGEFRQSFVDTQKYAGIVFITLAEAQDLFSQGKAVFVDSRKPGEFAAGHVPGAVSLPLTEGRDALEKLAALYSSTQRLIVYCEGGDCQTSAAMARLLHDRGFWDIRVLIGGWAVWAAAGMPAEAAK